MRFHIVNALEILLYICIFLQIATRYVHDPTNTHAVPPASLYFASGTRFECANRLSNLSIKHII